MKTFAFELALGRTIKAFVVKMASDKPNLRGQVCLVFSDDTWLELYTDDGKIYGSSSLSGGGIPEAVQYVSSHFTNIQVIERQENGSTRIYSVDPLSGSSLQG